MTKTFTALITDVLVSLGDPTAVSYSRTTEIWPWAVEAMLAFPILRPRLDDHTNGASVVYSYSMPADFRDLISVEYPISQQPPVYLVRKNRLDDDFYDQSGFYDLDHDYSAGSGWTLYVSGGVAALAHIKVQYLANHDTAMADDSIVTITVPDEYENILIQYCIIKAFKQKLSKTMVDPTAHTSIVQQLTVMTSSAEESYMTMIQRAQAKLADSRLTPAVTVDKYDRVY